MHPVTFGQILLVHKPHAPRQSYLSVLNITDRKYKHIFLINQRADPNWPAHRIITIYAENKRESLFNGPKDLVFFKSRGRIIIIYGRVPIPGPGFSGTSQPPTNHILSSLIYNIQKTPVIGKGFLQKIILYGKVFFLRYSLEY